MNSYNKKEDSIYQDLNFTDGTRAFITGSYAYGTPREDSDLDVVVLVNKELLEKLEEFSEDLSINGYSRGVKIIRFGKLNIIPILEKDRFDTWKAVTKALIQQAPVTRDHAVDTFRYALKE